jgi:hypothetical protein
LLPALERVTDCFKGLKTYFSSIKKYPATFKIVFKMHFHNFYAFLSDEFQIFPSTIHSDERQDTTVFEVKANVGKFKENLKIR